MVSKGTRGVEHKAGSLDQSRRRVWRESGTQVEESSSRYWNVGFVPVFLLVTAQLPTCIMLVGGAKQRMQVEA